MLKKTMFAVICAVVLFAANGAVQAKTATKNAPATATTDGAKAGEATQANAPTSTRPMPFYGKIGTVDKANKTFTIEGKKSTRTFSMTDTTKLEKAPGVAATWDDLKAGEYVRGSATKTAQDHYVALSVKIGPKEQKASTTQAQGKAKKQ